MDLKELEWNWDKLGKEDPLWAIITRDDLKGNKWDVKEFFNSGNQAIGDIFELLKSLDIKICYRSALDFGCGVGRLTQALSNKFEKVAGVDIAFSMIEQANRFNQYPGKCTYYHNTANDLALFKDESFYFVISLLVLQHMETEYAKSYIKEFIRILHPGGILIFQLPTHYTGPIQKPPEPNMLQKQITWWKQKIQFLRHNPFRKPDPKIAQMEMFGMLTEDMMTFLETLNVKVLHIKMNTDAEMHWHSNEYTIIKN